MTTRKFEGNEEHLSMLRQGVKPWNKLRKANPDLRPDLIGAYFLGSDLREVDLHEADLSGAHLNEADLRGADLRRANLSKVCLSRADLRGANLSQANLSGADLSGANLSGADLSGANLSGARLDGVNLRDANLRGADLTEAYESVDFTLFHSAQVLPKKWYKLLAYVHLPSVFKLVSADSRRALGAQAKDFVKSRDRATQPIKRGAEIMIAPELPGCRFNPPQASLLWLEAWHRADFQMQAEPDLAGFQLDKPIAGRVAFYVGPVLVGEAPITIYICEDDSGGEGESPSTRVTAKPYQSIFVSYSHKDAAIVDGLEKAYTVLGMEYLRDVRALRSGQRWDPALLGLINKADIFQLCWSNNAKASRNVQKEWHHALSLGRPDFIRPVYWEKPMPKPPRKLKDIHFAYLGKASEE
jgi:hypothetical protein